MSRVELIHLQKRKFLDSILETVMHWGVVQYENHIFYLYIYIMYFLITKEQLKTVRRPRIGPNQKNMLRQYFLGRMVYLYVYCQSRDCSQAGYYNYAQYVSIHTYISRSQLLPTNLEYTHIH